MVREEFENDECELSGSKVAGKRVVELGAGCGIAGMAMALLGCDVTATDIQPVLPILKRNLKRNLTSLSEAYKSSFSAPGKLKPMQLYWGNDKHICSVKPPFDFVIVTDVVYIAEDVEKLISTMAAVSDKKTTLVLGYRLRQQEAHDKFWSLLPSTFVVVRKIREEELHKDFSFEGVDLYILMKKCRGQ